MTFMFGPKFCEEKMPNGEEKLNALKKLHIKRGGRERGRGYGL